MFYYSVKDKVADDFAPWFPAKNDDDAIRMLNRQFAETVAKDKFFRPNDYELYCMVDWKQDRLPFDEAMKPVLKKIDWIYLEDGE